MTRAAALWVVQAGSGGCRGLTGCPGALLCCSDRPSALGRLGRWQKAALELRHVCALAPLAVYPGTHPSLVLAWVDCLTDGGVETQAHSCHADGEKVHYLPRASPDPQVLVRQGCTGCGGEPEPWALSPPLGLSECPWRPLPRCGEQVGPGGPLAHAWGREAPAGRGGAWHPGSGVQRGRVHSSGRCGLRQLLSLSELWLAPVSGGVVTLLRGDTRVNCG